MPSGSNPPRSAAGGPWPSSRRAPTRRRTLRRHGVPPAVVLAVRWSQNPPAGEFGCRSSAPGEVGGNGQHGLSARDRPRKHGESRTRSRAARGQPMKTDYRCLPCRCREQSGGPGFAERCAFPRAWQRRRSVPRVSGVEFGMQPRTPIGPRILTGVHRRLPATPTVPSSGLQGRGLIA